MSAGQKFACVICSKEFKAITNSHLKNHGMTTEEYKTKYPHAKFGNFDRFESWRCSNENRENLLKMNEIVYSNEEIRERRKRNVTKAVQSQAYRQNHRLVMKNAVETNPEKFRFSRKPFVTDRMKMSNYDRWVEEFGLEEAEIKMKEWKSKNKLPSLSFGTKIENTLEVIFKDLNISYTTQYKGISKYYCDFYLPDYHVIVEADGDYWHANPKDFCADDEIGSKKMKARTIWKLDEEKSNRIRSEGYGLIRYWESDIKNITKEKVFEDIVHASRKLVD